MLPEHLAAPLRMALQEERNATRRSEGSCGRAQDQWDRAAEEAGWGVVT